MVCFCPQIFRFHGIHTLAFPPHTPRCYEAILFSLCMQPTAHSLFPLCSPESQATVCQSTYADWRVQISYFIFGVFRYLSDITMLSFSLKRKAVNIQALWVVAASDLHVLHVHTYTKKHIYISAGSTASHSVLALQENSSPPQKGMGYIHYSQIPL